MQRSKLWALHCIFRRIPFHFAYRSLLPLLAAFVFSPFQVSAEDPPEYRSVYIAMWMIRTPAACDAIINDILSNPINAVFVQVRGRGDAYYFPNREDAAYPNTEPRAELYSLSPADFDPLQYLIDRLHNAIPRREVHTWMTTMNVWNQAAPPSSPNHVYNAHPDWITENKAGQTLDYGVGGLTDVPLDAGIPAVRDHIVNVFMDVVRNYDIDGIHFDYVRMLSRDSGYDPVAKARFKAETGWDYDTQNGSGQLDALYEAWRRDQITRIVQRVHDLTMFEKPWVDVSAFLVNFDDSIVRLGQGYNWWVAHGAIDVLHPGCYGSTVNATLGDWNFYLGKLAQHGDLNTRPLVAAVGEYLLTDPAAGQTAAEAVRAFRDPSRNGGREPDGYNFFRYGTMFNTRPASALETFGAGGPCANWAPVPPMTFKTGEESIPPNPAASPSVSLIGGIPRVTFQRPSAATDGDLPVHYRLYRGSSSPVHLYYDDMIMEWWDLSSARASFTFDDESAPAGTNYYAVVAYDDWNNRSLAQAGSVNVAIGGGEYVIETRSGGQHVADYTEPAGTWYNSSSHSTATGCTAGIGSRFALPADGGGKNDRSRFTPSGLVSGTYDVFTTCFNYSSANAPGITVRINDASGISTSRFNLTAANCGNAWIRCATLQFTAGQGHCVEFDDSTQTTSGTNDRMNPAAVRFVRVLGTVQEPKPPISTSSIQVSDIIVDSEPMDLDYDDSPAGATTNWATTTYGTNYGGSARYYAANKFPVVNYAVWVADLPAEGRWAIDGYVRPEQSSLAQGVRYRFVDGSGTVRNTVATLRTGTGGFTVNVDGVSDANAYTFHKGRVFVSIYGNTTGSEMILADALRFRYLDTVPTPIPTSTPTPSATASPTATATPTQTAAPLSAADLIDLLLKRKTFPPDQLALLDRNQDGQLDAADLTILLGNP